MENPLCKYIYTDCTCGGNRGRRLLVTSRSQGMRALTTTHGTIHVLGWEIQPWRLITKVVSGRYIYTDCTTESRGIRLLTNIGANTAVLWHLAVMQGR